MPPENRELRKASERGAVLIPDCDCWNGEGECWEVRCTDCGRQLEAYDDETAQDFVVHFTDRDDALDNCTAHGYEWWEDESDQPVLCGGCIDIRLDAERNHVA